MITRAFLLQFLILPGLNGFSAFAAEIDYDRDIRPLLSDHCFTCHGPDDAKRKSDLRLDTQDGLLGKVSPGKIDASELYSRITSDDSGEQMPPTEFERSLSAEQVSTIRRWIEEGAEWKGHWAFERVERPELPKVLQPGLVKNPIDAFILARLEAEELELSPRADARVLGRRLWFDLTGLPPTPEALDTFEKNPDVAATAGQLFQKPAYAERMTSRWLDAARYADTSGYQSDGWRTMWRWRDWVIDAFRRNQSFDRFTIEQLAGDLLPNASIEQKIATAFNRNHRGNAEGGIVPEEFQVEYVVDRVDTTFTVWQGVTIGCARCHSHKYDPFTHQDYYQLFAFFNRLPEHGRAFKEGNSAPWMKAPTPQQAKTLTELTVAESRANEQFEKESRELERQIAEWEEKQPIAEEWADAEGLVATTGQSDGAVAKFGYFDSFSLGARIKTPPPGEGAGEGGTILSKMVPVDRESGYSLQLTARGSVQLNLVKRWLDDSLRVETVEPIPLNQWTHVFATYDGTRKARGIQIFVGGVLVPHKANLDYLNQSFDTDEPLRVGDGASPFNGEVTDVAVFDRVLDASEIRAIAEPRTVAQILAKTADARSSSQKYKIEQYFLRQAGPDSLRSAFRNAVAAKHRRAAFDREIPTVMVMQDSVERPTHVLLRGQYDQPAELVSANVPASLPSLPAGAPRNRLGLARWLVSRDNPLTARVTVNRMWRDLFGTGLVKTTEDFGVQGERPSHPELLDWLSVEFMDSGWDLQHLLAVIVSSNTYQQSSRSTPELNRRDPENRLLARGPRFRLPAEMIRDQALSVSGLLTEKLGGPSAKPYQPEGLWKDIASDGNYVLSVGPDLYRRSLYTFWKRTVPPPMMMNFDSAGREACEVAVRRTNTPMQALNLMNDVTYVESARVAAQTILAESEPHRIQAAFRRILLRDPAPGESEILQNSLDEHLSEFRADPKAAMLLISSGASPVPNNLDPIELAAWTMICNTLMNLDEAVTKE